MGDRKNTTSIPLLVDSRSSFPSPSWHQAKVKPFACTPGWFHQCALAHRSRAGAAPFLPQAASSCLGETLFMEMLFYPIQELPEHLELSVVTKLQPSHPGEGKARRGRSKVSMLLVFECHTRTQRLGKWLCAGTQGLCSWEHLKTKASKIQPVLGSLFGLVRII